MTLRQKLALAWRILWQDPGTFEVAADRELPQATDEMQELMNRQIKEVLLVFSTHGHSGFSASYAIAVLEKLLRHEPLGPLTGEPEEWRDVSEFTGSPHFQNIRCSRVFKDGVDQPAYDIEGRVFRDAIGAHTSKESRVYITFPYTPTTEYVDLPEAIK